MPVPLLTHDDRLIAGSVVDRPNRFVVRVDFGGEPERVFLGDPGALEGIVEPGNEVLCSPVDDESRATEYDAVAAVVDGTHVSLRAALANDLFARALARGHLDVPEHTTVVREPQLPDHGRTDFRLDGPDGPRAYVEVKSCTYVEDGVARFPDRPIGGDGTSGASNRSSTRARFARSRSWSSGRMSSGSNPTARSIPSSPTSWSR